MPSPIQRAILDSVRVVMTPVVRFLLRSGIGFREFAKVCKYEFVRVATNEYGIRGRPTNVSRVAVMTGLTRKEIKAIRDTTLEDPEEAVRSDKLNPPTQVLHYWHNDKRFRASDGSPLPLQMTGSGPTFSELVKKYAGDIPPGAMRVELTRAGAIGEHADGAIYPTRNHFIPIVLDEKFIRSMSFSLSNLAETLVKNAQIAGEGSDTERLYERYIWSSDLTDDDIAEFQQMAELKSAQLLSDLDKWIGDREQKRFSEKDSADGSAHSVETNTCGLGVYYFRRE